MASPASSLSSVEGILPAKLLAMGQKPKPVIKISFNGADDGVMRCFTTGDRIEGRVSITSPYDLAVATLEIEFIGSSKTFVERMTSSTSITGRTEAFHQFLKLSQPIPDHSFPETGVFEAGKTYDFKYLFVIPDRLLPRVCRHAVDSDVVHESHLRLPPSLGEQDPVQGKKMKLADDFSPDMSVVRYAVAVRLMEADEGRPRPHLKVQRVRVVPVYDEAPPLSVDVDSDYLLRAEKRLRKGVFQGRHGTLVVEAAQPASLHLPPPSPSQQNVQPSTLATIMLRFDPAEEGLQPPRLGTMASKLKVATFFATGARQFFPSKKTIQFDMHQGYHTENLSLPSRCVAGVSWEFHPAEEVDSRHGSLVSSGSGERHAVPEPSKDYESKHGYFTAQILVPITLPAGKTFVPTFHSCLISRMYTVSLHLGIHGLAVGPSVALKVPVQVSSDPRPETSELQHRASLTAQEQAVEEREADDFFQARTVSPLSDEFIGQSNIGHALNSTPDDLPPEYSFTATRRVQVGA